MALTEGKWIFSNSVENQVARQLGFKWAKVVTINSLCVFPFSILPRQGASAPPPIAENDQMSSNTETATIYDELLQTRLGAGQQAAVDRLVAFLESEGRFHEMFEALKMQLRVRLGLPAAQLDRNEKLAANLEVQLEQGLIEACRRVGEGFFKQGKIREGWMYMRPVGDRASAAALLAQIEVTDDNVDEMLEVLLHEGVDIARGYQTALDRLGTCNSITLFESALGARPRGDHRSRPACLSDMFMQSCLQLAPATSLSVKAKSLRSKPLKGCSRVDRI